MNNEQRIHELEAENEALQKRITDMETNFGALSVTALNDLMKLDLIKENWDKIKLADVDNMIKRINEIHA